MAIVSHLHHLFNPETCQSSIHTLRWKGRPLQWPRCQSRNVGPWGTSHAQPGLQRYRWKEKDCTRTFNDLTGTLLDGSKRSLMHWMLATFLWCLSVVPVVFLSPRCPRGGGTYADGLSLVLVAAQCCPVLRDGAAVGGHCGSG